MIYLFHGSDEAKTREKAFAWIAAARAKEPNLAYVRLDAREINDASLADAAASGGLFVSRLLVALDDPYADAASGDAFDVALSALADSDNAFVVVAPKLSAAREKKLSARAKKTYVFGATRPSAERDFNAALVNALGARDGVRLWLEIVRARRAGDAPEMVHGLLHWKARDLMKKGGGSVWRAGSARALSLALLALPHESRERGVEFSAALERFALSL